MTGKTKATIVLVLGILALVAGEYLAGFLVKQLLPVPELQVEATTYWRYLKALDRPEVQPYVFKIRLSGGIGFGVPLLAWCALLAPIFRTRPESSHGNARFATMSDLKKA